MANDWSGYRAGEQALAQQVGNAAHTQDVDLSAPIKIASEGFENAAKGLSELADQTEKREDAEAYRQIHDIEKEATEKSRQLNDEIAQKEHGDVINFEIDLFNHDYKTLFSNAELEDYNNKYHEYKANGGTDDIYTWMSSQLSEKRNDISYQISQAQSDKLKENKEKILDYTADLMTKQIAIQDPKNALKPETIALELAKARDSLDNIIYNKKIEELTSENNYYTTQYEQLKQNEGIRLRFDINKESDVTRIANLQYALESGRIDKVASILGVSEEQIKNPQTLQKIQNYIDEVNEYRKAVYIAKSNINRNQAELGQTIIDSQHNNFWARHPELFAAYSEQANSGNYEQQIEDYARKGIKEENTDLNTNFINQITKEELDSRFNKALELQYGKQPTASTSSSSKSSQGTSQQGTSQQGTSQQETSNNFNKTGQFRRIKEIQDNLNSVNNIQDNQGNQDDISSKSDEQQKSDNKQNEQLNQFREQNRGKVKTVSKGVKQKIETLKVATQRQTESGNEYWQEAQENVKNGNYIDSLISAAQAGTAFASSAISSGLGQATEYAANHPILSTASASGIGGILGGGSKIIGALQGVSNIPGVGQAAIALGALVGTYNLATNIEATITDPTQVPANGTDLRTDIESILDNNKLSDDKKLLHTMGYLTAYSNYYNTLPDKEKNSVEARQASTELTNIKIELYPTIKEYLKNKNKELGYENIVLINDARIGLKKDTDNMEIYFENLDNPNSLTDLAGNDYEVTQDLELVTKNSNNELIKIGYVDLDKNKIYSSDGIDITSMFRAPIIGIPQQSEDGSVTFPLELQGLPKSNQSSNCVDFAFSNNVGTAQIRTVNGNNVISVEDISYNTDYFNMVVAKDKDIDQEKFKANLVDIELFIKFGNIPQDYNYTSGLRDLAYIATKCNLSLRDFDFNAYSTGRINGENLNEIRGEFKEEQEKLNSMLNRGNPELANVIPSSSFGQLTNNGDHLYLLATFASIFNDKIPRQTVTAGQNLLTAPINTLDYYRLHSNSPQDQFMK